MPGWAGARVLPRDTAKTSPLQPADSLGISPGLSVQPGEEQGLWRCPDGSPALRLWSDASPRVAEEALAPSELSLPYPLSCPDPDPARSQRSGKLQQGLLRQLPELLSSAAGPLLGAARRLLTSAASTSTFS